MHHNKRSDQRVCDFGEVCRVLSSLSKEGENQDLSKGGFLKDLQ
jgi:hypothetical protein